MVARDDLLNFLNALLKPELYQDYCPNGLQVLGKPDIQTIVTGVTANQALLDAAIDMKADMVLVHHGYFWKGEQPVITGIAHARIKTLLLNDMNLVAYHLPLDGQLEFGNNTELARVLDFTTEGQLSSGEQPPLTFYGQLQNPMSGDEFAKHIETKLNRAPLHIAGRANPIKTIAWCTGGAQDFIETAITANVDAYLTGEVSERTVNTARETGIHFYAAGHHATERYGIKALGQILADKFPIEHCFIDIDNPA